VSGDESDELAASLNEAIEVFKNSRIDTSSTDTTPNHITVTADDMLMVENEGLTYSIWTTMGLADKSPLIIGSFSSTPEKFDDVVQIMLQEWRNFATKGATALEVEEAKKYLIASYNLRFAAVSDIAEMMMLMQRDNLGVDFLQKRNNYVRDVSLEQVNRVAAQYYNTEKLVRVNIGVFAEENKEHE